MSRMRHGKVCDKNCFECPFDDCIYDDLDLDDVKEQRERDAEHRAALKSEKELRIAAKKKAYYEANREDIAAKQKAYREANREDVAAKQKAYREANREDIAAYHKAYYEANREKLCFWGQAVKTARKSHGYTQAELAKLVGCCRSLIGHMETGIAPPREELFEILPELKEVLPV